MFGWVHVIQIKYKEFGAKSSLEYFDPNPSGLTFECQATKLAHQSRGQGTKCSGRSEGEPVCISRMSPRHRSVCQAVLWSEDKRQEGYDGTNRGCGTGTGV